MRVKLFTICGSAALVLTLLSHSTNAQQPPSQSPQPNQTQTAQPDRPSQPATNPDRTQTPQPTTAPDRTQTAQPTTAPDRMQTPTSTNPTGTSGAASDQANQNDPSRQNRSGRLPNTASPLPLMMLASMGAFVGARLVRRFNQ